MFLFSRLFEGNRDLGTIRVGEGAAGHAKLTTRIFLSTGVLLDGVSRTSSQRKVSRRRSAHMRRTLCLGNDSRCSHNPRSPSLWRSLHSPSPTLPANDLAYFSSAKSPVRRTPQYTHLAARKTNRKELKCQIMLEEGAWRHPSDQSRWHWANALRLIHGLAKTIKSTDPGAWEPG